VDGPASVASSKANDGDVAAVDWVTVAEATGTEVARAASALTSARPRPFLGLNN
jgi:hypothetical protein